MSEFILPFLLIVLWTVFLLLLVFLKIMKSHTLFFSSLVAWTSVILLACWVILFIYAFVEDEYLIGVMIFLVILVSYIINIIWCTTFFQPYIVKKDAFYYQWMRLYAKTKCLIHFISYAISFIMFRVSLCRFLSLGPFSAALHRDRYISRIMNYFSIAYILAVLCFIISVNLYVIIAKDVSDGALYHHIVSLILSVIQAFMLLIEVCSGNKINTYDSFLLKSTYNKIKYEAYRGKYEKAMNEETILESKLKCIYFIYSYP